MDRSNEAAENAHCVVYQDVSEELKYTSQARYARMGVLVLGLVSVVVFGVGASFFMEKFDVNLKSGTDPREGTMSLRLSEVIPESESFDLSQEELPRILAATPTRRPTRKPTRRPTASPATTCQMQRYTLSNIAQHNGASNCWMSLYGVVYDLTAYVGKHPGGAIILDQCGTNATPNFDRQHGVSLLQKKGFASYIIGRLGSSRGVQNVPCSNVKLVSVTGARRLD